MRRTIGLDWTCQAPNIDIGSVDRQMLYLLCYCPVPLYDSRSNCHGNWLAVVVESYNLIDCLQIVHKMNEGSIDALMTQQQAQEGAECHKFREVIEHIVEKAKRRAKLDKENRDGRLYDKSLYNDNTRDWVFEPVVNNLLLTETEKTLVNDIAKCFYIQFQNLFHKETITAEDILALPPFGIFQHGNLRAKSCYINLIRTPEANCG